MGRQQRDVEKERKWAKVIREAARSGRSIREFCAQHKLNESQFYRWQRKLRERREDIPYLIEHFIRRFNAKRGKKIQGVSPAVMEILMRHDFLGNARELENLIEYCFVLCSLATIDPA